ncbi:HAD family hydrolase [Jeotgalibacillus sp. ET6]|uniref:HAD family hydrolase n=1 Tax=Jeotgalibacillus sp. ET6 TaxID=3037260 RepID=UPI0024182E74|nr:HAD family hydrolase [Jeotgalibacillus sp. ET6]MDG5472565.1 HAD family hydrolase [Jeotgalibacillus sp. ET6]
MSSWLACIDLDGTLLTSSEQVTPYTRAALQNFRAEGNKVALVTGRHPRTALPIKQMCGEIDGLACFNGSWVMGSKGRKIHAASFDKKVIQTLARELKELNVPVVWSVDDALYITNEPVFFPYDHRYIPVINGHPPPEKEIWKITLLLENEENRREVHQWCRGIVEAQCIESSARTMDLMPLHQSKGYALEKLAAQAAIPLSNTIAIGNWDNDISMLEKAEIGVAMTNSSKTLFSIANEIAGHHDDHGVARWLSARCHSRLSRV